MEVSKKKVTAKLTSSEQGAAAASPAPVLVRAKISGTARPRTRTTSAVSAPLSHSTANGTLRPLAPSAAARRSPSPSKMMQAHRPVNATLSKAAGGPERTRHGSISSVLSLAPPASASAPPTPIVPFAQQEIPDPNHAPAPLRVKAKVSGLVKAKATATTSAPSPSTKLSPGSSHSRTPSVISSTPTLHQRSLSHFHADAIPLPTSPPASTLSASSRSSSPHSHLRAPTPDTRTMSSLIEDDDPTVSSPLTPPPPQREIVARVRPGTRISGGRTASVAGSAVYSAGGSAGMDDTAEDDDDDEDEDDDDEGGGSEKRVHDAHEPNSADEERAEAKSNRKIADLEITTRSLLTINASLEAAKVRQARELRELRRRLRETRLILPPRAFRALRNAEGTPPEDPEEESEEENAEDEDKDGEDEAFVRLRALVEGMLDAGRKALAVACPRPHLARLDGVGADGDVDGGEEGAMARPEVLGWESGGKHGVAIGSRVLSPEEAGFWVGKRDDTPVAGGEGDAEDEQPSSGAES